MVSNGDQGGSPPWSREEDSALVEIETEMMERFGIDCLDKLIAKRQRQIDSLKPNSLRHSQPKTLTHTPPVESIPLIHTQNHSIPLIHTQNHDSVGGGVAESQIPFSQTNILIPPSHIKSNSTHCVRDSNSNGVTASALVEGVLHSAHGEGVSNGNEALGGSDGVNEGVSATEIGEKAYGAKAFSAQDLGGCRVGQQSDASEDVGQDGGVIVQQSDQVGASVDPHEELGEKASGEAIDDGFVSKPMSDQMGHGGEISQTTKSVLDLQKISAQSVAADSNTIVIDRSKEATATETTATVAARNNETVVIDNVWSKRRSFVDIIKQNSPAEQKQISWADAVNKKLEKKSIEKNNSSYLIPRSVMEIGAARYRNALVGHFFGMGFGYWKVYNYLLQHWKLSKNEFTLKADEHFFYLYFTDETHRKKALEECFLFIAGKVFIVREWTPQVEIQQASIKSLPIWVKFWQIPKFLAHLDGYSYIASVVGTPLYLDRPTAQGLNIDKGQGRICIEIEYGFEFPASLNFKIDELEFTIKTEYDWIPPRCDFCECFGHLTDLCSKHNSSQTMKPEQPVTQRDKFDTLQNNLEVNSQKQTNAPNSLKQTYKVKEKQVYKVKQNQPITSEPTDECVQLSKEAVNSSHNEAGPSSSRKVSLPVTDPGVINHGTVMQAPNVSTQHGNNEPQTEQGRTSVEDMLKQCDQAECSRQAEALYEDIMQQAKKGKQTDFEIENNAQHIDTLQERDDHTWTVAKKKRDYTSIKGKFEVRDTNIDLNQGRVTRSKAHNPEVSTRNSYSAIQEDDNDSLDEESEEDPIEDYLLEQYSHPNHLTDESSSDMEFDGQGHNFYGSSDPIIWDMDGTPKKAYKSKSKPKIRMKRFSKKR